MTKYTYEDIIMDPDDPRLEGAIGKECYFADYPKKLLNSAIYDLPEYLDCLTDIRKEGVCTFVDKKGTKWASIIIKKEPSCEDQVKQWIEKNNLKVGDYVKVLRKTELYENKWRSFWVDEMSEYIGKALKVLAINSLRGLISLECDDAVYDFPYFVLEKAEKPKLKYVPFENVTEFLDAYRNTPGCLNEEDYFLSNHGIWLKAKYADDALFMVTEIWSYGVVFSCDMKTTEELEGKYLTINEVTTWKELFRDYCFIDGSPCGKEVKDE